MERRKVWAAPQQALFIGMFSGKTVGTYTVVGLSGIPSFWFSLSPVTKTAPFAVGDNIVKRVNSFYN